MFCSKCGNEIAEGEKFCGKCGAPVPEETKEAEESKVENAVAAKEAAAEETKAAAQQTEKSTVPEKEAPAAKAGGAKTEGSSDTKKKGKGKLVPLILVLVLLIAGGSGAALYFTSDGYKIGKNEKLAAECMDAGEYKDAIGYYKEVLKLDASLVDVYESMAEAYLGMEKEDKALEVLQDGLKACKKDEEAKAKLTAKQVEIYSGQIDRSLEAGNYQEAYTLITAAYEETGAQELLAKRADVYQAESTAYQNSGDYAAAREVLQRGIEETGEEALKNQLEQLYLAEADSAVQAADYDTAEQILTEGITATGDASGTLIGKIADIYRLKSDNALVAGDVILGIELLEEGFQTTGSSALSEREAYVKEHIEALPEEGITFDFLGTMYTITRKYDDFGKLVRKETKPDDTSRSESEFFYEYDEDGNVIEMSGTITKYDYADNTLDVDYYYEYEYDTDGNPIKVIETGDNHVCTKEYDANGKLIHQTLTEGEKTTEITNEWNAEGKLVRDVKTVLPYPYDYSRERVYDEKGNIIRYEMKKENAENPDMNYTVLQTASYEYEGERCIKVESTLERSDWDEIDTYAFTLEYSYDEDGLVSNVLKTDSFGNSENFSYLYGITDVIVEGETGGGATGIWQPVEGELSYQYDVINSDVPKYNAYGRDAFGNEVCAVGTFTFEDHEEAWYSYQYRYTGE